MLADLLRHRPPCDRAARGHAVFAGALSRTTGKPGLFIMAQPVGADGRVVPKHPRQHLSRRAQTRRQILGVIARTHAWHTQDFIQIIINL